MIKYIGDIENQGALYSQNKLVMFVKIWERKEFEEIFWLDQMAAANCLKSVILNSFSTELVLKQEASSKNVLIRKIL